MLTFETRCRQMDSLIFSARLNDWPLNIVSRERVLELKTLVALAEPARRACRRPTNRSRRHLWSFEDFRQRPGHPPDPGIRSPHASRIGILAELYRSGRYGLRHWSAH